MNQIVINSQKNQFFPIMLNTFCFYFYFCSALKIAEGDIDLSLPWRIKGNLLSESTSFKSFGLFLLIRCSSSAFIGSNSLFINPYLSKPLSFPI